MKPEIDVHADDYGYTVNTSKQILDCIKQGKLDSISIICNTKWFDESVRMLYEAIPSFSYLPLISVHLNLPEGDFGSDQLPLSWEKLFLLSYSFTRNKIKNVLKKELRIQINKTQAVIDECIRIAKENGVPVHQNGLRLDSHTHTHLVPVVWEALTEVIEEEKYKLEFIRNPKEPILPFLKDLSLWPSYGVANIIKNRILMMYSGKVDRYCESHDLKKVYMWGLMMSGKMNLERIEKILPEMARRAEKDGRTLEILFHPGQALKEEYDEKMNPDYFREFNTSENRNIERRSVMKFNRSTGEQSDEEKR